MCEEPSPKYLLALRLLWASYSGVFFNRQVTKHVLRDDIGRRMHLTRMAMFTSLLCLAVLSAPAHADPNRVESTRDLVELVGEKLLGETFPASDIPGFLIARGSLASLFGAQRIVEESPTPVDVRKMVLLPLRSVEAAWPDPESANGTKIPPLLWSCRDLVVLSRMQVEYVLDKHDGSAAELRKAVVTKEQDCRAALARASTTK